MSVTLTAGHKRLLTFSSPGNSIQFEMTLEPWEELEINDPREELDEDNFVSYKDGPVLYVSMPYLWDLFIE